jgi:hypothetical protein
MVGPEPGWLRELLTTRESPVALIKPSLGGANLNQAKPFGGLNRVRRTFNAVQFARCEPVAKQSVRCEPSREANTV